MPVLTFIELCYICYEGLAGPDVVKLGIFKLSGDLGDNNRNHCNFRRRSEGQLITNRNMTKDLNVAICKTR